MTTLFGVLLLVGGFTVLAVVRPWQSDDRARREVEPPVKGGFPPSRPRPGPRRGTALTGAAGGRAAVSGLATTEDAATTDGGADLRGSATVIGAGAGTRRPSPVRGASPVASSPVRDGAAELSGPVRGGSRDASGPVRGVPGGAPGAVRGGSGEAPSPVVPLKPRPAARRGEPRADRVPVRHHRVESIQRGRRLSAEPGDTEIVLPEWLGPMSVPGDDAAPVRARHAG